MIARRILRGRSTLSSVEHSVGFGETTNAKGQGNLSGLGARCASYLWQRPVAALANPGELRKTRFLGVGPCWPSIWVFATSMIFSALWHEFVLMAQDIVVEVVEGSSSLKCVVSGGGA